MEREREGEREKIEREGLFVCERDKINRQSI